MKSISGIAFKYTLASLLLFASFNSYAAEVYWKSKTFNFGVKEKNSVFNVSEVFNRVVKTVSSSDCSYYEDPEIEIGPGYCYEVECKGYAGKSQLWDKYFSAKKEDKADRLANAIKGIGKQSAEKLVRAGYFQSKPRTFSEFKKEITSANNKGVITSQVRTMVLSTYRNENINNLGYNRTSCYETSVRCEGEVVIVREGRFVPKVCVEEVETVLDSRLMNYEIQVSGTDVLPLETDKLNLELSGEPNESRIVSSKLNTYSLSVKKSNSNNVLLQIQSLKRNQVVLPDDALQSVALYRKDHFGAVLQVSVVNYALPVTASEQLEINYTINTCDIGWLGVCGIGWDNSSTYTSRLDHPVESINLPNFNLGKRGIKVSVDVAIRKVNSKYHTPNAVSKTTETIKLTK